MLKKTAAAWAATGPAALLLPIVAMVAAVLWMVKLEVTNRFVFREISRENPRGCRPTQNVVDAKRGGNASGRRLRRVCRYKVGVMLVAMEGCLGEVGVKVRMGVWYRSRGFFHDVCRGL